jgi:hypothetical protein
LRRPASRPRRFSGFAPLRFGCLPLRSFAQKYPGRAAWSKD